MQKEPDFISIRTNIIINRLLCRIDTARVLFVSQYCVSTYLWVQCLRRKQTSLCTMKFGEKCAFLCLLLSINSIRAVQALWGAYVTFENNCRRTVRVNIDGGESGSLVLGPYEEDSFYICSSLCTGFLGATKTHYYSYSAETESYLYDCYWSGVCVLQYFVPLLYHLTYSYFACSLDRCLSVDLTLEVKDRITLLHATARVLMVHLLLHQEGLLPHQEGLLPHHHHLPHQQPRFQRLSNLIPSPRGRSRQILIDSASNWIGTHHLAIKTPCAVMTR